MNMHKKSEHERNKEKKKERINERLRESYNLLPLTGSSTKAKYVDTTGNKRNLCDLLDIS